MQFPEMRALRLLRSHSNILIHSNHLHSRLSCPCLVKPYHSPQFSSHFMFIHSLNREACPQSSSLNVSDPIYASRPNSSAKNPSHRAWSVHRAHAESSGNKEDEYETKPNLLHSEGRGGGSLGDAVLGRKKGKSKVHWVCSNCGQSFGQWWGTCAGCRKTGTIKQFSVPEVVDGKTNGFEASENALRSWLPGEAVQARPMRLRDVSQLVSQNDWRIPL